MNAAYLRERALCHREGRGGTVIDAGTGEAEEEVAAEERGVLQRAEALTDRFCEQVRGDLAP